MAQIGLGGLRRKLHRDGDGVAVHHRHAIAVRADLGGQRLDVIAAEIAQDLLRLLLHLLFFAADEGDHVGDDVHGRHARIAGAGDGLHGGGDHARDAELASAAPSAMVSTTVEQLGLVTIWPFQPRARCWHGNQLQMIRD